MTLAQSLERQGRYAAAADLYRQAADQRPDDRILGLAQRATGSPQATATLRRFLAVAPGHPAAAEVHRLLGPPS